MPSAQFSLTVLIAVWSATAIGAQIEPIASVIRDYDDDLSVDRRGELVRVRGVVTTESYPAFRGDVREYRAYIQDGTAGLRVIAPLAAPLEQLTLGNEVELSGTIGQYSGMPFLRLRTVHSTSDAPVPPPRTIDWREFEGERLSGSLVRLRAPIRYAQQRYLLGDDEHTIRLFLRPAKAYVPFMAKAEDGDLVNVTGILEQFAKAPSLDVGYRVRPRQREDVFLVPERPTPVWPAIAGAAVLVVALGLIGWRLSRSSRRRVAAGSSQRQRLEALGTLSGGVAHEFNNYLMAMLGFTELANEELPEGSEARHHLAQVTIAGKRAQALTQQILSFSRQEEPTAEILDAHDAIAESTSLLRAALPTRVAMFEDLARDAGTICANRGQLSQMLLNLGTNAAHAMPAGGELHVRLQQGTVADDELADLGLDKAGDYVVLTVRDTGQGMNATTLERAFDPFFSTRGPNDGTGLGLSLVHAIVRRLGGTIQAESEIGKGSTFVIHIPVADPERTADADADEPIASIQPFAPAGGQRNGDGIRVLLVDDQPHIVQLCQRQLETLGCRVVARTDGHQALAVLRDAPGAFDIVVTDLTMPKMSGLELARNVHELRADLPVLLMTGNVKAIEEESELRDQVVAVLTKPFDIGQLRALVEQALAGTAATAQRPPVT